MVGEPRTHHLLAHHPTQSTHLGGNRDWRHLRVHVQFRDGTHQQGDSLMERVHKPMPEGDSEIERMIVERKDGKTVVFEDRNQDEESSHRMLVFESTYVYDNTGEN